MQIDTWLKHCIKYWEQIFILLNSVVYILAHPNIGYTKLRVVRDFTLLFHKNCRMHIRICLSIFVCVCVCVCVHIYVRCSGQLSWLGYFLSFLYLLLHWPLTSTLCLINYGPTLFLFLLTHAVFLVKISCQEPTIWFRAHLNLLLFLYWGIVQRMEKVCPPLITRVKIDVLEPSKCFH